MCLFYGLLKFGSTHDTYCIIHVIILFFGSPQILENHIKNELIEKSQLVRALPCCDETKLPFSEPRKSASIACGASVFEVCLKVPTWASQVT